MMDINFIFWFIISLAPKRTGQFVTQVYVHVQNWSSFVTMYTSKTGRVLLQGTIIKPFRISEALGISTLSLETYLLE